MRNFLGELRDEYERIAQNQDTELEPGLTADEVMQSCLEVKTKNKAFRKKIDKLLEDLLYPMLENFASFTEEDEAELFATAQKLSSYTLRLDPSLALTIYHALLAWARSINDTDKIIKYLYWCGITTFFFYGNQDEREEQAERIYAYFSEGAAYADAYHSFAKTETRSYIHRCIGNTCMMMYQVQSMEAAREAENKAFSFWNGLMFEGIDEEFPWLNYFLSCLNHRHGAVMVEVRKDPDMTPKELLRELLELSMTIHRLYRKNSESFGDFGGTRYEFSLWEAQFLCGLISFDYLHANIEKKKAEYAPDDFSSDALYVKLQLNAYLMFYAAKMRKMKDKKDELLKETTKDVIEQFARIPMNVNPSHVGEQLQSFATALSDVFKPAEQLDFVIKMTIMRHIPTYAHSLVVSMVAECLTDYLLERNPGYLAGCLETTGADDVRSRADELRRYAGKCGLCHDIGKITYVSNPFMQNRVLTPEEFQIVKKHPQDGAAMLNREDGATVNNAYSEVIKGHHKYYDNSAGYPEDYDTSGLKSKPMIDVIAVANAIDAATDELAKAHKEAVSLDEIIKEIISEAGRRYSPEVAMALTDVCTVEKIRNILDVERKNAYYKAYQHTWEETS